MRISIFIIILMILIGCSDDQLPKPYGEVRLEYPEAVYTTFETECPFMFEYSSLAIKKPKDSICSYNIYYPNMKATIYLTYEEIPDTGIYDLIQDSEKSVYEPHTSRATYIEPKLIVRERAHVFGTLYELGGESAMNYQFHLTDSTHHFLRGSVYFRSHPKPDSLAPALSYIKKDVMRLMETLQWRN
ncbi:gliding motility lipoprotein GldD [Flavobacteriaceae bacterium Ap0902]|nr:gliding motility lipoprotein GldD [Flavobacteriaceae bacterium Ap0902]